MAVPETKAVCSKTVRFMVEEVDKFDKAAGGSKAAAGSVELETPVPGVADDRTDWCVLCTVFCADEFLVSLGCDPLQISV